MDQHAWEVVGCIVVLIVFAAAMVLFGSWLDDQGEQEWWGNEE